MQTNMGLRWEADCDKNEWMERGKRKIIEVEH